MTPHFVPPQQPTGGPSGKPGRKLGPIAESVGSTHRAWLEPLRSSFLASGMTISDMSAQTGWAKSKISELLRGTGLYPRWEITHSLLSLLGVPTWPMRRLWTSAAREARKKPEWIERCVEKQVLSAEDPPLDHGAFTELQADAYLAYATVFLSPREQAVRAVRDTFDILWLGWNDALASSDVVKYAWPVLRRTVMTRARHVDGRPELSDAAFDTIALRAATTSDEKFAQIEESVALFATMSWLPDHQLDVMVLRHLRGMEPSEVADVLGVPIASVRSDERHAKHTLETALCTEQDSEGNPT